MEQLTAHICARVEALNAAGAGGADADAVGDGGETSLLIELREGQRGTPPVFLVHPVGGLVYFYRQLSSALEGEYPVYGIVARGVDGHEEPHYRVEDMARDYIREIRTLCPDGPYRLGGSSFGGMVAYEMALQLTAAGEDVDTLAMIDTPGPGYMPEAIWENDVEIVRYLLQVGHREETPAEQFKEGDLDSVIRYFLQRESDGGLGIFSGTAVEEFRIYLDLFRTNGDAMLKYVPSVPFKGRIHFFRALEKDHVNAHHPEKAWEPYAGGGMVLTDVPGNHITMNVKPNVEVIAEKLSRLFKALEQGKEGSK